MVYQIAGIFDGEFKYRIHFVGLGHSLGKSVGHGHSLGKDVGHSLCKSVGHSLGKSVGHSLGRSVGHSLGKSVGYSLGKSVRHSLGKSVGQFWALSRTTGQPLFPALSPITPLTRLVYLHS